MPYETSKFGDGGYTSGVSNVTMDVSNFYGPRTIGGEQGVVKTEGGYNEATVNFDADGPAHLTQIIPAGSVVVEVLAVNATGAIATATVGSIDISGADGTQANYVAIPTAGQLTVTGPTAGEVLVRYLHIAS